MTTFTSSQFTIEVGSIINSSFDRILKNQYATSKVVIIVDENTHDNCLEFLLTSFDTLKDAEVMLLPEGEQNKVMEVCFQVWEALSEYQIGRSDLIINLGGGVITDMGGFIASVFKRGVDFINIPTSLLGMVDASIGGKTGIDLGCYKNQLGTFAHPKYIFIDPGFLESLPEEEWLNGYAEMFKHALISDKTKFDKLKSINSDEELKDLTLLTEAINVKFEIVEEDPYEKGKRKILNFGHTIGHGIEGYFLSLNPISHGHSVAIGMIAESFISMKRGLLNKEEYYAIELALTEKFPMIEFNPDQISEIVRIIKNDKKNSSNNINCVLLKEIGECVFDQAIEEREIHEALFYLNRFSHPMN